MKAVLTIRQAILAVLLSLPCVMTFAETSFTITEGVADENLKATMEKNVSALLAEFRQSADEGRKNVKLSKDIVTKDAQDFIREMWQSSAMSCPPVNIRTRCLKTARGYQVRGIPVDMIEADESEARQELTINFNDKGVINGVAVAIEMNRYEELMREKASDVDYVRRQVIVDFVENFRTAYNRKDLKMLQSVYSDKALIITGKVVAEKPNSDLTKLTLTNNKVVYIKQTKQEYLKNLSNVFKIVKYINVDFSDIEITEHPKYDDIYGVTLKQKWHTDRYQDEGYLFLMVDFRDSEQPVVQVRTWQPYKDKGGKVITAKKDVFHLGSFRIIR